MPVTHLFKKTLPTGSLEPVPILRCSTVGIIDAAPCLPLRQVLIVPSSHLLYLDIPPGELRENIVYDDADLILKSGSILQVGEVTLQITFECEPCKKVMHIASAKKLLYRRGLLAKILVGGEIHIGSTVAYIDSTDCIPYKFSERVEWFLKKNPKPIYALELLYEIGFSASYARALPRILESLPDNIKDLVIFQNNRLRPSENNLELFA